MPGASGKALACGAKVVLGALHPNPRQGPRALGTPSALRARFAQAARLLIASQLQKEHRVPLGASSPGPLCPFWF